MQERILCKVLDVISAANTLTLPMDVRSIAKHYRCRVHFYSRCPELLEEFDLTQKALESPALSIKMHGEYYVFLSDDLTVDRERQLLSHELGHVFLGHLEHDKPASFDRAAAEREADVFELMLLAPPPVLEQYAIHCTEDVRRITGLSLNDSRTAYRLLEDYRFSQQEAVRRADIARRTQSILHTTFFSVPYQPQPASYR